MQQGTTQWAVAKRTRDGTPALDGVGIADSVSSGFFFSHGAPVANYNPRAPTVGITVDNGCLKSQTLHSKCHSSFRFRASPSNNVRPCHAVFSPYPHRVGPFCQPGLQVS
jgi:hypothetical protein